MGDGILRRGYPGRRGVSEIVKQLLGSWSSRGKFAPTHQCQSPQRIRETQRLGIIWLPWTLPIPHGDQHCDETEVVKRSDAG